MSESMPLFEKTVQLINGVRTLNRAKQHEVLESVTGDDEPCYWQRKEWIEWILELADDADTEVSDQTQSLESENKALREALEKIRGSEWVKAALPFSDTRVLEIAVKALAQIEDKSDEQV